MSSTILLTDSGFLMGRRSESVTMNKLTWVDLLDCRACLERAFLWDSDSSSRTGVRYDLIDTHDTDRHAIFISWAQKSSEALSFQYNEEEEAVLVILMFHIWQQPIEIVLKWKELQTGFIQIHCTGWTGLGSWPVSLQKPVVERLQTQFLTCARLQSHQDYRGKSLTCWTFRSQNVDDTISITAKRWAGAATDVARQQQMFNVGGWHELEHFRKTRFCLKDSLCVLYNTVDSPHAPVLHNYVWDSKQGGWILSLSLPL